MYVLLQSKYKISFIKFDVPIATFKNLLKMAVSEEHLNKTDIQKVD